MKVSSGGFGWKWTEKNWLKMKKLLSRLMTRERLKKGFLRFIFYFVITISILIFFSPTIHTNDYLNPFTLTFKNPKTVQMLNIIILYHYVMAFLVGIIVFTFIFIFLSFFRSYPFFYSKPQYQPYRGGDEEDAFNVYAFLLKKKSELDELFYDKKKEFMPFYKRDIRSALTDQVTHAPILEFLWVVLPAVILIFIAYPSVMMLYYNEAYVNPIYNISAIGNQWYWTYEYNDFNLVELFKRMLTSDRPTLIKELESGTTLVLDMIMKHNTKSNLFKLMIEKERAIFKDIPLRPTIDSNLIIAKDPKFLRLLSTDQCLVIPSKTPLRILVTSNDVIHSWAIPSYGVKLDAVPGRINQQLLNVPLTGTSWGQCSELCGVNHAYMPIEIKVLSFGDFLFYMELKVKELLLPYVLQYYKLRVNILYNFVEYIKISQGWYFENFGGPKVYKERFGGMLNAKGIAKYVK